MIGKVKSGTGIKNITDPHKAGVGTLDGALEVKERILESAVLLMLRFSSNSFLQRIGRTMRLLRGSWCLDPPNHHNIRSIPIPALYRQAETAAKAARPKKTPDGNYRALFVNPLMETGGGGGGVRAELVPLCVLNRQIMSVHDTITPLCYGSGPGIRCLFDP
jgi:hypothetical protein